MKSNEAKKKQKYLGNCVRRQRWNHKTNNYVFCTGASNGIKKTPKFKADFVDETEKANQKKVSRRLLERSQLFVFMVKAPQTSNQFQKSLELYQIFVRRNICPGQPQSEWFSIENEFIVTKNSNKKLTIKKEQIQFLFKAANRSKGNTEQCVFP